MADIVERYLDAIVSHDWDVVSACVADDIVRVGPYGDRYEGRDDYMPFISDTMPSLKGYAMEVHRVTYVNDGLAFAELSETVEVNGKPMLTPEVLVFELDADSRIARVDSSFSRRGLQSRNRLNLQKSILSILLTPHLLATRRPRRRTTSPEVPAVSPDSACWSVGSWDV